MAGVEQKHDLPKAAFRVLGNNFDDRGRSMRDNDNA